LIRYLTLGEIVSLHRRLIEQSGGSHGLRDLGALESAVAQPRMTFGGDDLYPTLTANAVALGFSLIKNHPFIDGNKRIGHLGMEMMLVLNGREIHAEIDDSERVILGVAAGEIDRAEFLEWLESRTRIR